jgi:DNA-binding MarR family transcriptional regulator
MTDAREDQAPPAFNSDDVLPYMVVRVGERLERFFAGLMTSEGLTVRQFGILSQFASTQVMTAADIARRLRVTPQSIGPQIDALSDLGLLSRTPVAGRGRPIEVRLTDAGQQTLRRVLKVATTAERRLTGHMSKAQRATMMQHLREIARLAEEPPHS